MTRYHRFTRGKRTQHLIASEERARVRRAAAIVVAHIITYDPQWSGEANGQVLRGQRFHLYPAAFSPFLRRHVSLAPLDLLLSSFRGDDDDLFIYLLPAQVPHLTPDTAASFPQLLVFVHHDSLISGLWRRWQRYEPSPAEVASSCDVTFAMLADPESAVISQGAISAPMFSVKGPSMVKATYPTAFPLKHQQKDLRLALGLAESVTQPIPVAAAANELYKVAKSYGLSDQDFSAVIEALRAKLQH
ncbi:hypothetical protein GW17_00058836 [Ensete ventricosum]|nr:hypothetical protein GW17_00058836 [Ensete ventricosum]